MTTGFFTRRFARLDLPLPDLPQGVKRVILNALRTAWTRLLEEEPDVTATADETFITACLQEILNEMRGLPQRRTAGFSASLFETVTREGAEVNFSGQSVRKQPDLVIRMKNLHPGVQDALRWGAFIECKIVSRSHPVSLYCKEGISRFVKGDYAWAMPSAMMIAYARNSETVDGTLTPYLTRHKGSATDPFATRTLPAKRPDVSGPELLAYVSSHGREWEYPHGGRPGSIEILHLWLPEKIAVA